jgi:hypothetical protein
MQKNIGNFTTLLKSHNIGIHLKGIETSFQMVPLFLKSFNFLCELYHFLKFSQNTFTRSLKDNKWGKTAILLEPMVHVL